MKNIIRKLILIVLGILFLYACETDVSEPPTSQTNKIEFDKISAESDYREIEIEYTVNNLDMNNVQALGLCYNISGEPTINDNNIVLPGSKPSGMETIDGLSIDTDYFFRLYAKINGVVVYSDDVNFSTLSSTIPTVETSEINDFSSTTASSGGNIGDDGGLTITARGVCWSTSQNPTISDYHTNEGSGTGTFTSQLTGLNSGTDYYVRAYATNSNGTAYGEQKSFMAGLSGTFADSRDGQTYGWKRFGDQIWMTENLNYNQSSYGNDWCYDNNSSNCDTYGRLYDWYAVMQGANSSGSNPSGVQGVCPDDWHVPSDEEWKELEMYMGMSQSEADDWGEERGTNEGSKLAGNESLWSAASNIDLDPEFGTSGFDGLPGGYYDSEDLRFERISESATFWTSFGEWSRRLSCERQGVGRTTIGTKNFGYSLRCVKD